VPTYQGLSFAWRLDSCDELAGDTLNVIPLDDDHLGLYVLDVSGHGVPAALLSVTLHRWLSPDPDRSILRSSSPRSGEKALIATPDEVAKQLNSEFPLDPATAQYFTLIYGVFERSSREFRYVCAGHPPPIHVPNQGAAYQPEWGGTPIGFLPESEYETDGLVLQPGDRLYLFSDGLPESADEQGQIFDIERVVASVESHRSEHLEASVESIVADARRWRGNRPPSDDLTLLGIEIS
jgi:sigma-B regulation protein RsbU (phosphoserine phosphatase)